MTSTSHLIYYPLLFHWSTYKYDTFPGLDEAWFSRNRVAHSSKLIDIQYIQFTQENTVRFNCGKIRLQSYLSSAGQIRHHMWNGLPLYWWWNAGPYKLPCSLHNSDSCQQETVASGSPSRQQSEINRMIRVFGKFNDTVMSLKSVT